ncbi:phosphonoacetaldehyde reductase [Lysobacter sp. CA199]|uniref:phosphonoacetaldehyde reductase n=1 Tax=Lysobacter sp. CA199 TaxID=3455608 RepID=UPI003F8D6E09
MFTYRNPVELIAGEGALSSLKSRVQARPYVLLTHAGPVFEALAAELETAAGHAPLLCIDTVADNPDLDNLRELCAQLAALPTPPQLLIALGGGSVIDACKVLSATGGRFDTLDALLAERAAPRDPTPFIAVPTTAGTGSEVTCWATVWDRRNNRKHSLAHPSLYAQSALLEPRFTASLPAALTVSTALDALSHALESLWNRNRNPVSATFAIAAARAIVRILPASLRAPRDLALREQLQLASLYAGLAFSNTKTSLAHNISYRITLEKGVSHGIACSITLPMLVRAIGDGEPLAADIERIFDAPPALAAQRLEAFFAELGVATDPRRYGYSPQQWQALVRESAEGQRGRNFSGDLGRLSRLYDEFFHSNGIPSWQS